MSVTSSSDPGSHTNFFNGAYTNPAYASAVVALGMAQEQSIINKLNQTLQRQQATLNMQAIDEGFSNALSQELGGLAQGAGYASLSLAPAMDGINAAKDMKANKAMEKDFGKQLQDKDGQIMDLDNIINIKQNPDSSSVEFANNDVKEDLSGNVDALKRSRTTQIRERDDIKSKRDAKSKEIELESTKRGTTTKTFSQYAYGAALLGQTIQNANSTRAGVSQEIAKSMESATTSLKASVNQMYDKILQIDPNAVLLGIARA